MILEALGILKILEWATAGDRYQPAPRRDPEDKYGPPHAVDGGEICIVTNWWRGDKRYFLQGRCTGAREWVLLWWPYQGSIISCIPDDWLKAGELTDIFSQALHDPAVLESLKLKSKACG